jgi:hypothetical protein
LLVYLKLLANLVGNFVGCKGFEELDSPVGCRQPNEELIAALVSHEIALEFPVIDGTLRVRMFEALTLPGRTSQIQVSKREQGFSGHEHSQSSIRRQLVRGLSS